MAEPELRHRLRMAHEEAKANPEAETMERSERRMQAARELRDRLRAEGNHRDAQVVQELLRTLSSTRGTLKVIHRDNRELRDRADAMEGEINRLNCAVEAYEEMAADLNAKGGPGVFRRRMEMRRLQVRAEKVKTENARLRELLADLRTSAAILQQNAEGCAINHYGHDYETHGLPGWLVDTRASIDRACLRQDEEDE